MRPMLLEKCWWRGSSWVCGVVPEPAVAASTPSPPYWFRRGSTVLQRPPQLNFAFGHWKIDVTGFLRRKFWRGSSWVCGVVPEPAVAVDAGRHTGLRADSTVLQRPPQLNFAFGHWKIDATDVAGESCGVGRLVFGVSCPNKPLQLTPAAILVSRAVQQFSSGRRN